MRFTLSNRSRLPAALLRGARLATPALLCLAATACDGKPAGSQTTSRAVTAASSVTATAKSTGAPDAGKDAGPQKTMEKTLAEKIAQFAPAKLTADLSQLPDSEKQALDKLIEASKLLEPIFDRQAYAGNPSLQEQLSEDQTPAGKQKLAYFKIMRGPWDRQAEWKPFATTKERPPGGGFYPGDLTKKGFDEYLAKHPEDKEQLESLFTVVRRQGDKLVAVPYSKAYAKWLEPASKLLEEAAKLTKNKSLATFLTSRAKAFLSDDYYQSDKDWMDLDSQVEITIGPYEVYEDELKALKAAFESFVTVTDPEESKKLAKYKGLLVDMENNLPIPDEVKTKRGKESPIRVVDLVFSSGDARKSVQTIAFNLPNDEKVRQEKGAKKVLLRNLIEKKFDIILRPIAKQIIAPAQQVHLSAEAFFNQVLFHELSHSLGPAMTEKDGQKVEVRLALESSYSAIEECKADVMGAYNLLYMIEREQFDKSFRDKLLVSYFAGLFRSVRFGVGASHGKGAAVQINRFLEEGAATFDAAAGRYQIDLDKLEKSIKKLVSDLCMIQHKGDKATADELLNKYGVMSKSMTQALGSVEGVPVDIKPIYPSAGEE